MFDLVRNNKKFIQIILALIILPFALWGVESYVGSSGGADELAKVGELTITRGEFDQSLREQQDRLRSQQEMIDSPSLRSGVLQDLINQKLLRLFASQAHLRVSDETLAGFIASVPSLQENGKFSRERYEALVAAQGMSVDLFEARVRQDLIMQQAMLSAGNGAFVGQLPAQRWVDAQLEERVIREHLIHAGQFVSVSKPDEAAVKRYYEQNRARFEKPELVKLEFLVLSQDRLVEQARVSDADIKATYQANLARYTQPEQRQASHILFRVDKQAPDAELKAVQAKAEQVLAQLKSVPTDFAKLAKQHSQDPGSAEKGGDLGFFGRGMMVKSFEDAAFGLKEGQITDLVRSDFGFHIIRLTGIRPERARPLEEVSAEISAELKRQSALKLYAEAAEGFSNLVYEQADSLKPAAEKYGLTLQTSDWIARDGQVLAPFNHAKLRQLVFSDDAVKSRRNTEAVDIGGNVLISARVTDHRPAAVEPLESVSASIVKQLQHEMAVEKAVATGEALRDKLAKDGHADAVWGTAQQVSRMGAPKLAPAAREAVFSAAVDKLPAYAGAKVADGYAIYRIDEVKPHDDKAGQQAVLQGQFLRQQYAQVVAQEDLIGWLASLRQRYPVSINPAALERK